MSIRSTKQTQAPAKTTTKQKAGVATNYIFLLLIPVGKVSTYGGVAQVLHSGPRYVGQTLHTLVAFKMRGEYEESAVDATLTSNVNTLRRNWRIFTLYPEEAYAAGEGRKLLHKRALGACIRYTAMYA
ncbi:unnamed protein product [Peronospora farinosa]|uniref:Methylated-DNA-[protein]-cysteine S-methyltransferase DNA binding domain-containing protein n=1 Tax=Peronospora farinosa TaxID=134698 RepID=A0ABN8BXU1_9STRA|nr:unnamed protein product [Peronospora farinosa]